jgi:hypothetical protein
MAPGHLLVARLQQSGDGPPYLTDYERDSQTQRCLQTLRLAGS